VLLSEQGTIKICDFGSSKQIDPQGKNTPYIVSRYYRAPELILCVTRYTTAIDVWATGCILAEMFTLQPIFKGKT
jgi:serine/threonine protein kinase